MSKRMWVWMGVATLFLISIWGLYGFTASKQISFTEQAIQEHITPIIGKQFSVTGKQGLVVKTVHIKDATVHIKDGQLIALVTVGGILRTNKEFSLTTETVGVPSYSGQGFFFKPSKVEVKGFNYAGTAPSEAISSFAEKYVSDEKIQRLLQDSAPKIEEWIATTAQAAAMRTLEERPIYSPKNDAKGLLVKASLESVKVDGDRMIITFSLWQFTVTVLLGALCLILAVGLTWVLFTNPGFGVAIIALSSFS